MTPRLNSFLGYSVSGFHKVCYTEWGDPENPNVVFCVHGLSRNGRDFDYLAKELVRNDMRVICPDMPGRGKSDWLASIEDYSYPKMISDLMALIARSQATRLHWIGTSMGGLLGMILAATPNTPIDKLVINDVGAYIPSEPLRRIVSYLSLSPIFDSFAAAKRFLAQILTPFGPLTDDQLTHLTNHGFFTNSAGKLQLAYDPNILKAFTTDEVDLWSVWETLNRPVLLLRGADSEVLSRETALKMCEKPNVSLVQFPNVAHAPALVSDDQIEAIISWLI